MRMSGDDKNQFTWEIRSNRKSFASLMRSSSDLDLRVYVWEAIVKICVLDKFHLGMSYSAVDCELNINESTIYIK